MIPGLRQASIEASLVDLMIAVHEGDSIAINHALEEAKDSLGFDPTIQDQEFNVILDIPVWEKTPEAAIREFIKMVQETPMTDWVYIVRDENGDEHYIDGPLVLED